MNTEATQPLHVEISSKDIELTDAIREHVHSTVERLLGRFASKLTRIEIHLNDRNADKSGPDDKRCLMEARPRGLDPLAAEATDDDLYKSITEAAHKLQRVLDSTFGRLEHR